MKKGNKKKENLKVMEQDILEQDGVRLPKYIKERMERNRRRISHKFYILNKTGTLIDSILATPRNLLQPDSPILVEALEDEKCRKIFKEKIQETLENSNKDDLIPFMYATISSLECDEQSIVGCIATAQEEREELIKGIQEKNVFKIAKSIWALRVLTTAIVYFVGASLSFFKENELLDMHKFLKLAAITYADQVVEIENLMYED